MQTSAASGTPPLRAAARSLPARAPTGHIGLFTRAAGRIPRDGIPPREEGRFAGLRAERNCAGGVVQGRRRVGSLLVVDLAGVV